MAFTGITATEAEIVQKCGLHYNTAYDATAMTAGLLNAESVLNAMTRYNWSDYYVAGTPEVDVKYMITDTTASLVAIEAIKFDMSGFTSRGEAESMITVLRDAFMRNISILRDIKTQTFMKKAAGI